jgi:uncharacterized protein (TIGR02996 family)
VTPEDAFLQAIIADPDKDALRLIYADWLEEQGDAARAEFIRVQVEKAQLPATDPRQTTLRARQGQLWADHATAWYGRLPRLRGISYQRFWRGFVSGADVQRWKYYRAHADTLFAVAPVQFLRLFGLNAQTCRELALSEHLARLRGLDLSGNCLSDAGVRALAESTRLAGLRLLWLSGEVSGSFGPRLPPAFGEAGALSLAASPYLGRLERLDLRYQQFSERAWQALRDRFAERVVS